MGSRGARHVLFARGVFLQLFGIVVAQEQRIDERVGIELRLRVPVPLGSWSNLRMPRSRSAVRVFKPISNPSTAAVQIRLTNSSISVTPMPTSNASEPNVFLP